MTPYVGDRWVIIRNADGWGIVGGTLEPSEQPLAVLSRKLLEEAGAQLVDYHAFGAFRMQSLAEKPYRPPVPHPVGVIISASLSDITLLP